MQTLKQKINNLLVFPYSFTKYNQQHYKTLNEDIISEGRYLILIIYVINV